MGRKRSEKGAKPPKSAKSDKAGKSENVAEPESSEDRPLGEKMVTQKKGGKGAGKADPKPRPAPKNVGPRRTRGAAREEAAAIGAAMAESVAERTDPVLAEKKVSVAEDSTVPPKDAGVADPEETVERTGGPQGGVQSTQPGGSGFKDSGKESTAAAGSDKGGNGEKGTGKQKEQAKERAAPKPVAGEGVQGAGADKGAAETEMSRRGEVGKKSDAGAPKAQLVQEEAGPSGTAGGGRGPLTTEDTQEGEIGSGEFFGEKISPERLKLISQIAQNVKEGKGGDEALGLSANEVRESCV